MPLEGDERAVTVVIGAVLMFGILVTSLAMYQVNVVPDQNHQAEWDHHQEVTGDLLDLRNAVVNAGYENSTRETSVSLGTQYESRTFSINPPDPRGTIRTNSTGNPQVRITVDGSTESFNTSFIEYETGYHEFDAPSTVIEHGLVYEEHGHVNITRDAGSVISDERIIIPLIEGDLSESSRSKASISVETIDVYHVSSDVSEIRLPTNAFEAWNESYDVSESGDAAVYTPESGQDVYIAQVAVGDERSGNGDTSSKLDSFGDPVTDRGGPGASNEFGLEWKDDSVTGSPGETVTLTATIDQDVENAYADFSLRDSNGAVDSYDPSDPVAFQNGEATFDVTLSNGASDGETVQVYVSSGGTTKEATLTVDDGSTGGVDVQFDSFDAPASGTAGEQIQPSATVTNAGNESGTASVEYVFDGNVVDTQTVTLDSGAQTTVTFTYELPAEGTYDHYAQSESDRSEIRQIRVSAATGTVEGTVTDSMTDEPIAGASVAILEDGAVVEETSTDDAGAYAATVPSGTYDINVTSESYSETQVADVTVPADETRSVDVSLTDTGSLSVLPQSGEARTYVGSDPSTAYYEIENTHQSDVEIVGMEATITANSASSISSSQYPELEVQDSTGSQIATRESRLSTGERAAFDETAILSSGDQYRFFVGEFRNNGGQEIDVSGETLTVTMYYVDETGTEHSAQESIQLSS